MKFRSLIAGAAAFALALLPVALPAQADPVPSLVIGSSGLALSESAISNFGPSDTLRLQLTVNVGTVNVDLADSGALVAPGAVLSGPSVGIVGTQEQLNEALLTTTISKNCSASRTIVGTVNLGSDQIVRNSANGHLYALVSSDSSSWDDARQAALQKSLPVGSGFGYLANITSDAENTFVNTYFTGSPYFGASDAASEGDWFWMDGPEAGTKFFSAGAAVNNAFVKWYSNEPNNAGNGENYGQLWAADGWNDGSSSNESLVEFGGLPGNDFSAFQTASTTANLTVPVALQGAGTSASPYLVATRDDFLAIAYCNGPAVSFKQTQDISFLNVFQGLEKFSGHYDGNDMIIDLSAVSTMNSSLFGEVDSGSLANWTASIKNLNVIAANEPLQGQCSVSTLARSIDFATIDGVDILGYRMTTDCPGGIMARTISNSVVKNSSVEGEVKLLAFVAGFGGLAATAQESEFQGNECNVTYTQSQYQVLGVVFGIGGCLGQSVNSTHTRNHSSGAFMPNPGEADTISTTRNIGGLIGQSYQDVITESSSSMSITTKRAQDVGGLVGKAELSRIGKSFATGNIVGASGTSIGGLIGFAPDSEISNVFATGSVSGAVRVGGLVGYLSGGGKIDKAYSSGRVLADDAGETHGLVGYSDAPNVKDSYWKILVDGVPGTVEPVDQEVPKLPGELKKLSTFEGWSIAEHPTSDIVWALCSGANGGYPYLAWQGIPNGCARAFKSGSSIVVTGIAYVGGTLTAAPTGFDPVANLAIRWVDQNGIIPGAEGSTFKPTKDHQGRQIRARVVAYAVGHMDTITYSSTFVVAGAPKATVAVVGGFAAKASKETTVSKTAVAKANKGIGIVLSLKCEGFATGKTLTPAQKKLALARATTICAAFKLTHKNATVQTSTSLAKKTDKIVEGVRVTLTSVKP